MSAPCASREHVPPVPATTHGTFRNPYNEHNNSDNTWYCDRCAAMIGALGFFTPDPPASDLRCNKPLMDGRNEIRCWGQLNHEGDCT